MLLSGVFRLLSIERSGITEKKKTKYIHVNAVSFPEGDYVMIHAFGAQAEFIERNLNSARRALISGDAQLSTYEVPTEVIKGVKFNGETKKVRLSYVEERMSLSINLATIKFIDKRKDDDTEVEDEEYIDADEDILVAEDIDEEDVEETETKGDDDLLGDDDEFEVDAEPVEKSTKTTKTTKPTNKVGARKGRATK